MAWVTARTWHPEPSVALPRLHGDLARDMGTRLAQQDELPRGWPNDSWAFPRDIPRPVPAWVALWIAGVRRREGPWFEVRLERGEWQALWPHALGLIPEDEDRLKARHFVALWPHYAEDFVRGCRGPYTVMNTAGYYGRFDALVSPDPLEERRA